MMKLNAVAIVSLLLVFATAGTTGIGQSDSIEISYDHAAFDIFPESWLTPKINARANLLAESERPRCEEIVAKALAKYPADFLSANLKKLYFLGGLEYRGARTGGTNSRSIVYVVCKPPFKSSDVERNLHAELSSILFRNFSEHFETESWQQVNPPNFHYGNGGVQAVLNKEASSRLDHGKLEHGFLTQYSQASLEEDFNSFAGRLFMGEAELWNAMEKHSKIREKANLTTTFYETIDGRFNHAFFWSLRKVP